MPGSTDLQCLRYADPIYALGQATNLLRRTRPFAGYALGRIGSVIAGQIERNHYLFCVTGDAPVGYMGWAMCAEDVARAWLHNERVPNFEECNGGDCWVGITFYSASRQATYRLARKCRKLYPGAKVFGIREYEDRHRSVEVINTGDTQQIAAVQS